MDSLVGSKSMPPSFHFHPTDEELLLSYLKRKVLGKSLLPKMIFEVYVYRFTPWDLPSQSCLKTRNLNWYIFCPRSKKYANGGRANRSTEHGYWKATGYDRTIKYDHRPVGKIKTLVFQLGKTPHGDRTDWVMHEYRLKDRVLSDKGVPYDAYVLCKVYKKNGIGPKYGGNYGAPFVEEEWESDDDNNHKALVIANPFPIAYDSTPDTEQMSCVADTLNASATMSALPVENAAASTPYTEQQLTSVVDTCNVAQLPGFGTTPLDATEIEEDEFGRLLAMFIANEEARSNSTNEMFDGLEDLLNGFLSSQVGFEWSQFACLDDGFMELNDLN